MNQEEIKVNIYIVESNNDANLRVDFKKSSYCIKCGNRLDGSSLDRFCDEDCRREYYAEIRHDCNEIYSNVF
jgi:hypothetical protein